MNVDRNDINALYKDETSTSVQSFGDRSTSGDYNYTHFDAGKIHFLKFNGPRVGDIAPLFAAIDVNGELVTLKQFLGKKIVLETGSVTSPYYKSHIKQMNELATKFPDVQFLVLYVREEHPGKKIQPHQSLQQKRKLAHLLKHTEQEQRLILIDDLEGSAHRAYGSFPNVVYFIDEMGIIIYRANWCYPEEVETVLSGLMIEPSGVLNSSDLVVPSPVSFFRIMRTLVKAGMDAFWDYLKSLPVLIKKRLNLNQMLRVPMHFKS